MDISKPSFEVSMDGSVQLYDVVYNASPIGQVNWFNLRNGFENVTNQEMATIGDVLNIIYAAQVNPLNSHAININEKFRTGAFMGNTIIKYTPKGIFVIDKPIVKSDRIDIILGNSLEERLGNKEINGVVFSNDNKIRRIDYGFEVESQTRDQMSKNSLSIALTGDENAPEKLAEIIGTIGKNGYLHVLEQDSDWGLDEELDPSIRLPIIFEDKEGLCLDCGSMSSFLGNNYSFRVRPKLDLA